MTPAIYPVAGLPRSGSTLLQNILAQHPFHHATPTSGLVSLVAQVVQSWKQIDGFKAQGLAQSKPRVLRSIRGLMLGHFDRELAGGAVVFDKNRGWMQHAELLAEAFERPIPVICPVRDVRAVVASFEKLHRSTSAMDRRPLGPGVAHTAQARAGLLCGPGGLVGGSVNMLRDLMTRAPDRVILVPYRQLTEHPQRTMDYLHDRLGLPRFEYDTQNVQQVVAEDDTVHGWGPTLHTIRPVVQPPAGHPWAGVLPEHVADSIGKAFADVNGLAALNVGPTGAERPRQSAAP